MKKYKIVATIYAKYTPLIDRFTSKHQNLSFRFFVNVVQQI